MLLRSGSGPLQAYRSTIESVRITARGICCFLVLECDETKATRLIGYSVSHHDLRARDNRSTRAWRSLDMALPIGR